MHNAIIIFSANNAEEKDRNKVILNMMLYYKEVNINSISCDYDDIKGTIKVKFNCTIPNIKTLLNAIKLLHEYPEALYDNTMLKNVAVDVILDGILVGKYDQFDIYGTEYKKMTIGDLLVSLQAAEKLIGKDGEVIFIDSYKGDNVIATPIYSRCILL